MKTVVLRAMRVIAGDAEQALATIQEVVPLHLGDRLPDAGTSIVIHLDGEATLQRQEVEERVPTPIGMGDDHVTTLGTDRLDHLVGVQAGDVNRLVEIEGDQVIGGTPVGVLRMQLASREGKKGVVGERRDIAHLPMIGQHQKVVALFAVGPETRGH